MSRLENINRKYLDDFNENDNFYKILYRPGYAVQTRELNQQQAILQNQVKKFGEHIFKDGTIVLGGSFDQQDSVDYVKAVVPNDQIIWFKDASVVGQNTGVKARVIHTQLDGNHQILYVRYTSSSGDFDKFEPGEDLKTTGQIEYTAEVLSDQDAIGTGSLFSISEGTIFYNGYFINFPKQTVITSKYSQVENAHIVFKTEFFTVTERENQSLFDNAQGSPNFNAPGAHRLSAELTLQSYDLETELDESFITIIKIKDGNPSESGERTEYARLADELAKRTYDESGDYIVKGFTVYSREHLDNGSNEGRLTLENGGDKNLISIGVERGVAYVKGYEIEFNDTQYVDIPKSTDYRNVNNQISTVRGSNFFLVNQVSGSPMVNSFQTADLYDTAEERFVNGIDYTQSASGNKIGTCVIRTITTEMEGDEQWIRVYVMGVQIDPNYSLDQVQSIKTSNFFGDVITRQDGVVLRSPSSQTLLISTGEAHTRSIRSENGLSDTSFSFSRTETVDANSNSKFNISTPQTNETLPYGVGELFAITKNRIVVCVREEVEFSAPGTISCSGTTVTGSGTNFTTQYTVGERIKVDSSANFYTITEILSDTELEINESASFSNEAFSKLFLNGDIVRLSGYGLNGLRSVIGDTNSLEIDLKEPFGQAISVSITYDSSINEATERTKTLRTNRLVKIDLDSISSIYNINLGISDVYRLKSVRWSSDPFTDTSDGIDVTSKFILDTNQKDLFYDHSFLKAKTREYTSGYLLVTVDYFEGSTSQGIGYYSIDSYPINDEDPSDNELMTINTPRFKSAVDGNTYDLRNFLDFRPSKQNTAVDTTDVATATTNPAHTDLFVSASNVVSPTPGTQVTFDYSYYVSRKDVIVIDQNGELTSISGAPSSNPYFPSVSSEYMGICQVLIPPYPSIAGTYARILGKESKGVQTTRITHKRYTMRDIGRLDNRIKTLEYYNALNLLEKSASDLTIPDETGLDRFKNGFFVDGFMDHSLGKQNDPDYKIAVDRESQWIRPVFQMEAFNLKMGDLGGGNNGNTNSAENSNFITLPYNEVPLIEQNRVTTYRNIEQSVFRYIGNMEIDPPIDTWVDETTTDKTIERGDLEDDFGITLPEGTTTDWRTWSRSSTSRSATSGGYSAYDRQFGDRTKSVTSTDKLIGSYNSYSDAKRAANRTDRRTKVVTDVVERTTTTRKRYRQRVDTTVNVERETEELGNFVTDVSVIPYIRPQRIEVFARGLKANTRFHVWFDDENMNDYFNQYTLPSDGNTENATRGTEGDPIRSNEFGEVYGYLRLPENGKRFRIGTRKLRLTDSPTNATDATSYAETNFVASGLATKKQNTIYSTIVDASVDVKYGRSEVIGSSSSTKTRRKQKVDILGPSCMAYSFYVDVPAEEKGVFLSSVDVFIQALHPELGVWFEIREMSSDGGITRTQVPYSEVWMYRDDPRLKTSDDASVPTKVNFKNPVFLMNDTQYAFVIHTEGLNPDTYFFVSRLGEDDINSGEPVTGRQLTGTTYTTNNNLNWDIVPDVDLTVRFNRAEFSTSESGQFNFEFNDFEFFITDSLSDYALAPGDEIIGSERFNISNVVGNGSIEIGDTLVGNSTNTTSTVIDVNGSTVYTSGNGYSNGETVLIAGKNTSFTINGVTFGRARIRKLNRVTNKVILEKSNGEFFEGATLNSDEGTTFPLTEFYDFPFHLLNFDAGTLPLSETNARFSLTTVRKDTMSQVTTTVDLSEGVDHEFDSLMVISSRSVEKQELNGAKSIILKADFESSSSYVSPVFDVNVMRTLFVQNTINDDITDEDQPNGGALVNTYISKTVMLDEGNTAEDFIAYLSVYRPPNSDIHVWARFKNYEDPDAIETKKWIKLTQDGSGFSSRSNSEDFLEFEYHIPEEYMTGPYGEFQYASEDGHVNTGFDVFEVKIGLAGTDNVVVPKVSDLRAIALMV